MVLEPSGLLNTGTPPADVGLGFDPRCYFRDGDVIENALGTQRQVCKRATR
jgi:hypothetical protein